MKVQNIRRVIDIAVQWLGVLAVVTLLCTWSFSKDARNDYLIALRVNIVLGAGTLVWMMFRDHWNRTQVKFPTNEAAPRKARIDVGVAVRGSLSACVVAVWAGAMSVRQPLAGREGIILTTYGASIGCYLFVALLGLFVPYQLFSVLKRLVLLLCCSSLLNVLIAAIIIGSIHNTGTLPWNDPVGGMPLVGTLDPEPPNWNESQGRLARAHVPGAKLIVTRDCASGSVYCRVRIHRDDARQGVESGYWILRSQRLSIWRWSHWVIINAFQISQNAGEKLAFHVEMYGEESVSRCTLGSVLQVPAEVCVLSVCGIVCLACSIFAVWKARGRSPSAAPLHYRISQDGLLQDSSVDWMSFAQALALLSVFCALAAVPCCAVNLVPCC